MTVMQQAPDVTNPAGQDSAAQTAAVLNLHRMQTENVGDLVCAPYLYFPEILGTDAREILSFHQGTEPDRPSRIVFNEAFAAARTIVFGGGGLLEIDFFAPALAYMAEKKLPHHRYVIWGAGHNNWAIADWRKMRQPLTFDTALFDLAGVRDFDQGRTWVPCVSCMSPLFDRHYPVRREIGLYVHSGTVKNPAFRSRLPEGIDMIDNSSRLEDAIRFMAESELVLTDSFHGAYWATLLGRKVVGFPSSSKFYSFKHAIPLCSPEDWRRYSRLAQVYPEALGECRQANIDFAARVAELVNA